MHALKKRFEILMEYSLRTKEDFNTHAVKITMNLDFFKYSRWSKA